MFSAVEGDIHQWTVWLSKEAVWDRFRTMSPIASQGSDDFEVNSPVLKTSQIIGCLTRPGN